MNTDNPSGATSDRTSETVRSKHHLITKVLSPALRLWLRTQVQQVSDLLVKIEGSDRQIISGNIPRVSIFARHAVYQELHLSQIQLVGEGIRINLGQILRGQPLRLLEPVPVAAEVLLQESDINASLQSPLLSTALTELFLTLLSATCPVDGQINCRHITIDSGQLVLGVTHTTDTGNQTSMMICTGLQLASSRELQLVYPKIQYAWEGEMGNSGPPLGIRGKWEDLESFKLDLGSEVVIEELTLSPGQMVCRGRINIIPDD